MPVLLLLTALSVAPGCGTDDSDEVAIIPDGKADGVTFEYGFFAGETDSERVTPLLLVLHDNKENLPKNFAGHFDIVEYDMNDEEVSYQSGVFKLYRKSGQQWIKLQDYSGKDLGRNKWSYQNGTFTLGEYSLRRLNLAREDNVLAKCQALKIHEYDLEESFTEFEYPSIDVSSDGNGGFTVSLGSSLFDAEESTIQVQTDPQGTFKATVKTRADSVYVIEVPNQPMLRGKVLYGEAGGALDPMADIVCAYIPQNQAQLPCVAEATIKDCFKNYENYDAYSDENETQAERCAGWAMEDVSICGLICYLQCDDYPNVCDDDDNYADWVWDAISEACTKRANEIAAGRP